MITPQQFVELFLREKAAAWSEARPHLASVYKKYLGEPIAQDLERFMPRRTIGTVVEDVAQSGETANAVVCESVGGSDLRTRYRLRILGDTWKIIGIDRACFLCQGIGRMGKGNSRCEKCQGEGWVDRG
mgnify:CR=1 FL=1